MDDTPISIRRAREDEAPLLFDLLRELALFEHLDPPDADARARLLADGWGERPRFDPFVAWLENDAAPVGFCILFETYSTFLARPRLFVEDLYVRPDFRGRGVGKELIRFCLQQAHERGCWRVECMGLDWNARAHEIYEKMGATPLAEWFLYRFEKRMIDHHAGVPLSRRRFEKR